MAGDVDQVIQHLPSKYEALSAKPSTDKKYILCYKHNINVMF
jgi:hypothetical protein